MANGSWAGQVSPKKLIRWVGAIIVGVFWIIEFVELSIVSYLDDPSKADAFYAPRLIVFALGIVITWGLVEATIRVLGQPFLRRSAMSIAATVIACGLVSVINYLVFRAFFPADAPGFKPAELAYVVFALSWFLFSITGAILSYSYSVNMRARDAQLAEMRSIAKDAQLRALRYQLNPHFLFNTLNSIASLISRKNGEQAERMVENLSDFLRISLELEPHEDIMLAREIDLQGLYLGIETLRFPDRLKVAIDIPDELRRALVPSLITQPLIENAVKYSVARSSNPVTLSVSAAAKQGKLVIDIADEGGDVRSTPSSGTGVGLANVRSRLETRFGGDHDLRTSVTPAGGFVVTIVMPLRFAA